jgi:hypothetical protein
MTLIVRNVEDVERHLGIIKQSAARTCDLLVASKDVPLNLLWRMKFEPMGRHPIEDRALNLVEQINQTWTFVAALEAARKLLKLHENEEFHLAPGAHAALDFDIVSTKAGQICICAEVFAAVRPQSNNKLANDLAKLERHPRILHRYVFFMSPCYPRMERQLEFERPGIQVWSIGVPF